MEQERSAYLFHKYVNKECSAEELAEFMAMLRNPVESPKLEIVLDEFWDKSAEAELDQHTANEILNYVTATGSYPTEKKRNTSLKIWLSRAAAILIIGIAALLINNRKKPDLQTADHEPDKAGLIIKPSESIIAKTLEEHQKVTLPDGSTVILNNNSTITYPRNFKGNKREVMLTGEGYFDIKHDQKKSFTVYTGKIKTTVLGTAFNIKAYDKDKNIVVTVTRGKVSVVGDDKSTLAIITPNQQLIFNKDYKKSNLSHVVAKTIVQWQESDLFFDDISMEEAARILSNRFNTPITFSNNGAKRCRFTATFLKGESIDEILKIICSYNNAQYQTGASGITIKGQGCEQ